MLCTLLTATLVLTGCSGKEGKKLSLDEQSKFVEQVTTMLSERKDAKSIEETIDTKIKQLDLNSSTAVINTYIYSLYQGNSDMVGKVNALNGDIGIVVKDKKVDISKPTELSKLPIGLMKGLFQQLNIEHLLLQQDGSTFYASVDMSYVQTKYGLYIDNDLKSFITFREMEDKKPMFSSVTETFDIDEVVSRLITIEKETPNWLKSNYKDQWVSSQEYYYNIMLGVNHEAFNDATDKTMVKGEMITKYESIIKAHPDTQIGKDIKLYLTELTKSKNKIDANVGGYVTKFMFDKFDKLKSASIEEDAPTEVVAPTKVVTPTKVVAPIKVVTPTKVVAPTKAVTPTTKTK